MSNPLFTLSKMAQEQISKLLVDNNNAIGLKIGLSTKGCAAAASAVGAGGALSIGCTGIGVFG